MSATLTPPATADDLLEVSAQWSPGHLSSRQADIVIDYLLSCCPSMRQIDALVYIADTVRRVRGAKLSAGTCDAACFADFGELVAAAVRRV